MEFIFSNFLAICALMIMFASIYFQIKHIKFKRGAKKQNATIISLTPKHFWKNSAIEFEFEGKSFHSHVKTLDPLLHSGSKVEILVNPIEMTRFENPSWFRSFFINKKIIKNEHPKIYLVDHRYSIYQFVLIIFGVILMSLN